MASIQPHKQGYRAFVYVKGTRDTKTFRTQREAKIWAAQRESELRNESESPEPNKHSFGDAVKKYVAEVSPGTVAVLT